jgi:hypothetical protein
MTGRAATSLAETFDIRVFVTHADTKSYFH